MVICVGVEVLTNVNDPNCPGASALPVLLAHMMELPDTVLPQLSEFAGLVGIDGRLKTPMVQPYQKLLRVVDPVFCRRMV